MDIDVTHHVPLVNFKYIDRLAKQHKIGAKRLHRWFTTDPLNYNEADSLRRRTNRAQPSMETKQQLINITLHVPIFYAIIIMFC